MPFEYFLVLVALALGVLLPLVAIAISIFAVQRSRRVKDLADRIDRLEALVRGRLIPKAPAARAPSGVGTEETGQQPPVAKAADVAHEEPEEIVAAEVVPVAADGEPEREAFQWEMFIGQKALGWAAIAALIFAAAFFLRYAYQNNWIGPVGRVAIGSLIGMALMTAGVRYQRQGWRVFSQMISAGGIVVLYLSAYSAFGFYHLLPQQQAGIFMAVIVIESMIIAALYDSLAIGLVGIIGGLATPMLLHTDRDSYQALFTYLSVLNAGTVLLVLLRNWMAIGSVALAGTQIIFWVWYVGNYHPAKLGWALGFQVAVFGIFLAHSVVAGPVRKLVTTWEGLARLVVNAVLFFAAFYILMEEDYELWMGSAALVMATIYAALGRFTLAVRPGEDRLLLTSLAVAVGFIAYAFPIQANADWVAFGWAAMAAALWWFGQRVSAAALRAMAAVLAGLAVFRVLLIDLPHGVRDPFVPIFNDFALPSIGVAACLLIAVASTRPFASRLVLPERVGVALAGVGGVLLLWLILSVDVYDFFEARRRLPEFDMARQRWLGQLSLSVLWAAYASVVLTIGFRIRLARLRWLAIALYVVTIGKVFLIDMANLEKLYRILAFFILAIVLGLAARAYQRIGRSASESKGANDAT